MMESCCLQSPAITTVPSSLPRSGFIEKPLGYGRVFKLPRCKKCPLSRELKVFDFRAQASGTTKTNSEVAGAISNKADSKDEDLAFVAGATGRVGSRTVRELLKLGFQVRAGVRSAQKAETLVQSVKQMKLNSEGTTPVEKLEIVEYDLEKQDTIAPALGNASVVICCIGAGEKEVFDITGPYRIDYQATQNLIHAATVAKVNHFILVSSLGTNKVGFPAAILNLFWGVLIWKRKSEEALIASGLPYTIVRPGGMERPTDAFKETHNITLSTEDTLFGGLVSNLQVAELMACMAKNRSLSHCKVVEVVAERTAPLRPMEELLAKIPSQRADIYSPKESDAPFKSDSAPAKSIITEKPITPSEKKPEQAKAVEPRPLSPYTAYDDLKPPSSPSPTAPTVASADSGFQGAELSINRTAQSPIADKPSDKQHNPGPTSRPLSPFTMYEDLKPPTSPIPSSRKS
ncbi:PREDICTED: protein TIC 62, chloroplastic isoform X1 [Theobroma cacao]|uniref:Protein TIC 62, chloroplastic isoform X1 n=1 Tax=Theobroma cacao TaxID=3641 RepID=A0AB32VJ97_THECC|nr:PREDICTED: protein TIC 62, chloroplastic isoform X1 [Theobroma cacao]